MATSIQSRKGERQRMELKAKAVAFYAENNVPKTLEKLLNDMFHAEPQDVYGYMVRRKLSRIQLTIA